MSSAEVATRFAVSLQFVALPPNRNVEYPSKLVAGNVGPVSPFAYFDAHALATVAIVFWAADHRAFLLMLVNEGIAIAERMARTATTTTNSISEKPFSPGLRLSAR